MIQHQVLMKKPCQRYHKRGQEEVIGVCLNDDCNIRLACINCWNDDFHNHLDDLYHFDDLQAQLDDWITQYKQAGIYDLIKQRKQEFLSLKSQILKTLKYLENDFNEEMERITKANFLIKESVNMLVAKDFSLFKEPQAKAIMALKNQTQTNPTKAFFEQVIKSLNQILKDSSPSEQLDFLLKNFYIDLPKIPFEICNYFNQHRFNYASEMRVEMNLVQHDQVKSLENNDSLYFGGVKNEQKHGRGILMTSNIIFEGIWENNIKKFGQSIIYDKYDKSFRVEKYGGSKIKVIINEKTNIQQDEVKKIKNTEGKEVYKFSNGDIYEKYGGSKIKVISTNIQQDEVKKIKNTEGKEVYKFSNGDIYDGNFNNGRKEGKGIYTCSNGDRYQFNKFSYEGEYKNDKKEGEGYYLYSNHDYYKGQFKNDKKNGIGMYKCERIIKTKIGDTIFLNTGFTYEGEYKNDKKEGKGLFKSNNGDIYEGEFRNDQKEGKGCYKYFNGDIYQGEYKNDKMEGKGSYKYSNGDIYEGEYKNNMMEGTGIYSYSNGDKFKGDYKNDKKEGLGIYHYSNGDSEELFYKNGQQIFHPNTIQLNPIRVQQLEEYDLYG